MFSTRLTLSLSLLALVPVTSWGIGSSAPSTVYGPPASAKKDDPGVPPNMVLVRGQRTYIGTDKKDILALGEPGTTSAISAFRNTVCETPQHTTNVVDFYLGVTEVTREQYAAFVRATVSKPPHTWADPEVLDKARVAFLEQLAKDKQEAKENNRQIPQRKWDAAEWWEQNWQGVEWAVPAGEEALPVVWVDYQDARAYARWAGLRLMTEVEYQAAVRGKTKNNYPWGEEWDPSKSANSSNTRREVVPVGSFPSGASSDGILDLAGNAWEWTSSPFKAYDKFKVLELQVGGRRSGETIRGEVAFNGDNRVVVGGSFSSLELTQRCTTRRNTDRGQTTDALTFRVAASTQPGVDIAEAISTLDLPTSVRPSGITFDPKGAVAADKWTTSDGVAKMQDGSDIPNYSVIESYDYVVFLPVESIEGVNGVSDLDRKSLTEGMVYIGAISSTKPMDSPNLAAGTYMIAYRGGGEDNIDTSKDEADPDEEAPEATAIEYPEGMDIEEGNLIFFNTEKEMVAFLPFKDFEKTNRKPSRVVLSETEKTVVTTDEEGKEIKTQVPVDRAMIECFIPTVGRKGLMTKLPVLLEKGHIQLDWRR